MRGMSKVAKVTTTIIFLYRRYHSTWDLKDADRVFALMVAEARRLASTTDEEEINLANKLIAMILK